MIHEDREILKLTFITITQYPNNYKMIDNLKRLFEFYDEKTNEDYDCQSLIRLIKQALIATDIGIKDAEAIFNFSVEDKDSELMREIRDRLMIELNPKLVAQLANCYSVEVTHGKIPTEVDNLINLMQDLRLGGIASVSNNFDKLTKKLKNISTMIERADTSITNEEVLMTSSHEIGVHKLMKDREIENSFVLSLGPALDPMFGGGMKARSTYLFCGVTGGFKSGSLLNVCLYAREHAVISDAFLEGKIPLILYVSHENTNNQTTDRVLKWTGISKEEISDLTPAGYKEKLYHCVKEHPTTGVALAIRYAAINSIGVKDLHDFTKEYEALGYKVILLAEDYAKHLATSMSIDEQADKKMGGEKIAEELSDLTRKIYAPIVTAGQLNRDGEKALADFKNSGVADYLKRMNRSHVSGSYNATHAYEMIIFVDRAKIKQTNEEYVVFSVKKDRDNDGSIDCSDYAVMKAANDGVGFKIDVSVKFDSLEQLRPSNALFDVFNAMHSELDAEKKREKDLVTAKKFLKSKGLTEKEISEMSDVDMVQRAAHLSTTNNDTAA